MNSEVPTLAQSTQRRKERKVRHIHVSTIFAPLRTLRLFHILSED
jgi:hypothetical protein